MQHLGTTNALVERMPEAAPLVCTRQRLDTNTTNPRLSFLSVEAIQSIQDPQILTRKIRKDSI